MDYKRLAEIYGECWSGEAGEWNSSLSNKYLEYMITKFFEENFTVKPNFDILNIGIGAGYWDRYLSFKVPEGSLTPRGRGYGVKMSCGCKNREELKKH